MCVVVRHRAFGFSGAECSPCSLLGGIGGAVDRLKFDGGGVSGEPVEHASWSDGGELLAVTDGDQLRARAFDEVGEGVEAFVVDHPGLVEEHGRRGTNMHRPGLCAGDERVECERGSFKGGTVGAESLGG